MATGRQYYDPDLRNVKVNSSSTVYTEYPPSGYSSQLAGIPKYSRMDSVTIRVSWYTHNLPGGNIYLMMGDTQIGNGDTVQNTTKSFTHNVTSYFNSVNASSGYPKSTPRVKLTSGLVSRTVKVENFQISWSYTLPTFTISATATAGGTVSGDIGTYDVTTTNQTKTIKATPNAGYKFVGWKNSSGTVVSTDASMSITISHNSISAHSTTVSYTATFELTYSVNFSGMGATNGSVSSITASGGSFVLPSNGFYKEVTVNWDANASDAVLSYNSSSQFCGFAGWTRNPSGGDVHQPGETVSYTPLEGSSSLTMYAVWNPAVFPYPTPTRTGYRFTGWNTKADGSGTAYTSGTVSTLENLTLYAQWVKTYTVTASGENGTVTGNTGTFTDGDTTELTATPNPGYKFVKWILNGGAAGTVTDNPMSILVNRNLSITAVFEKLPPKFSSITITRSTDLAQVTINTPVEAGAKYIISVEVT